MNQTAQFLGPSVAAYASLGVASVHTLWGGFIISVTGGGDATVRLIERGAHYERRFALRLPDDETQALFGLAVERNLISAACPPRAWRTPDESAYTVTLSNGVEFWALQVWEHDPPPPAAAAMIAALRALAERAAALAPTYEGPFVAE